MSQKRASDVAEEFSTKALAFGGGGILLLVLGIIFYIFRGDGALVGLAYVLLTLGTGCLAYAIYELIQIRKITGVVVECGYCHFKNRLTETPMTDFMCGSCYKMIPILNGRVLAVHQVQCGFCQELAYYNEKTQVLLCEHCNHEIPISQDDGMAPTKKIAPGFAVQEDHNFYEFILVSHDGHHTENLIQALQHTLALNRNQVKDMLENLPVTLLQGIPKMKAEILQAQLAAHGAVAEYKVMP
ncbi:MAG: ribosomal protein L7/L12 [Fimbriimonadaceae bacterium]